MKKFKKIFAVLLTLAMVLGMGMTTFAAGVPSNADHANITIKGIADTDVTIKAYKIVEPEYEAGVGLTGYKVVAGYTIADDKNFVPTDSEIITIANTAATKQPENITFAPSTEGYVASVGAGEYLIIVESPNYTYNPMVVSAAYSNANDAASLGNSFVDASTNWDINGTTAFAKSSEVKTDKVVSNATQEVSGDVSYTITGTIPSYSAEYTNPTYKITDAYTNLTDVAEPTVTIGGKSTTKDTDYTYEPTENGFVITFLNVGSYANKSKDERAVSITYTAKIASTASVIDPATNTATLNYTHKPGETKDATPSTTNTYTFNIDEQLVKTGENNQPLAGSTFTLYKEGSTEAYKTCETAVANGKASIHFEGLNAGTYTMKETIATDGYSINDKVYTITIDQLTYDTDKNDKKLTGYTVTVLEDGTQKGIYHYSVNNGTVSLNPAGENEKNDTVVVQNTKLSSLPGTGGIGTTIFTIGGCAIMIIAAALFFASRRKAAK